ncbi:MAG: molecular chaperone DnaK [Orrella sp.]
MSDAPDLIAVKARLQAELAEVMAALTDAELGAATVMLDQSAVGRVSRGDALQQQAMAKDRQQRLDLRRRKLEAALNRVAAGQYGLCCQCEATLEPARLESDPAAVFCVDCLEERQV